jgi:hypothetical protein
LVFKAYTQVAALTVYTYLFSNIFAHQYLEPDPESKKINHIFKRPYLSKKKISGPRVDSTAFSQWNITVAWQV